MPIAHGKMCRVEIQNMSKSCIGICLCVCVSICTCENVIVCVCWMRSMTSNEVEMGIERKKIIGRIICEYSLKLTNVYFNFVSN